MVSVGVLLGLVASPVAGAGVDAAFSVVIATIGCLGLGYAASLFARRRAGAGALYEYLSHGATPCFGVVGARHVLPRAGVGRGPSVTSGVSAVAQLFLEQRLSIYLAGWVIILICAALVQIVNYLADTW